MPIDPLSMLTSTVGGLAAGGPSAARGSSDGNEFINSSAFNVGSGSLTSSGTGASAVNIIGQFLEVLLPVVMLGGVVWLAIVFAKKK